MGLRTWQETLGGHISEWSWLHHKGVHWHSLSEARQGVWALTGHSPHKSPDLRGTRLLAVMSPAPCLFVRARLGSGSSVLPSSMCSNPTW